MSTLHPEDEPIALLEREGVTHRAGYRDLPLRAEPGCDLYRRASLQYCACKDSTQDAVRFRLTLRAVSPAFAAAIEWRPRQVTVPCWQPADTMNRRPHAVR